MYVYANTSMNIYIHTFTTTAGTGNRSATGEAQDTLVKNATKVSKKQALDNTVALAVGVVSDNLLAALPWSFLILTR